MRILTLALFHVFLLNFVFAQNNDQVSVIDKKNMQNEIINPFYNDWENDHTERVQRGLDNHKIFIEIIGWSRTGLFAYRTRFYNPASSGSGYGLIIFNAVTDIIIENDEIYTSAPFYDGPNEKDIIEIRNKWNGLLNKYGIIGQVRNPVEEIKEGGYQNFGKENIECWFDYEVISIDNFYIDINWKLLIGIGRSQKLVSSNNDPYWRQIYARRIVGYYRSPYENRIVILTLVIGKGYDDFSVQNNLFGCHLDVGLN
jgi:hypothetical protein